MQFDNEISILLKNARELEIPSKFVKNENGKYSNIIIEINSLLPTGKSLIDLYELFKTIEPDDLAIIYYKYNKNNSVLLDINNFYEKLGLPKIRDIQELNMLTADWDKKYENEYENDMLKLQIVEDIQKELSGYSSLEYSPIQIDSTIILAEMKFKDDRIPTIDSGYEIFDYSVPSNYLPYINWNTEDRKELIKVYKGKNFEELPDYSKIDFETKEIKNTINFSLWKGEENITKESYLKVSYSLETNLMKIKIPLEREDDKDLVLNRISDSLPIIPKTINDKSISGELFIFNIEVDDIILSHMILNNQIFQNYFFMKEMGSSLATKKQLKIFFRSLSGLTLESNEQPYSLSFSITQNYAKGGENVVIIKDGIEENIILKANSPYIRLNISSSDSISVAEDFIKIFSRILSIYKSEEDLIRRLYSSYILEFSEYEKEKDISVRKFGTEIGNSKIYKLKQAAPELFISGYARRCSAPQQPIIILDEEIEEWEKQTFIHKGETLNRQVFKFPPDDPKYNFVCPFDKYPFPGVKKNKLSNKETYPGLPCCFEKDQLESEKSKYAAIYGEDEKKEKIKETETHMIKSDKILRPGRYGKIPSSISNLLKADLTIKDVRRKGVPRSTNSLLHCISMAIKDENYFNKTGEEEREKYIQDLRTIIAKKTYPGLCKQEMYDFKDIDILSSLSNSSTFLDPGLYYRAVEEGYEINLFIFSPSKNEKKRLREKEESLGVIELPRFKLFHSKVLKPERPNILIYRTMGSESDDLTYPQCELIVSYEENKEISIFGKFIYKLISDAILTVNRTVSWELVSEKENIETLARNNLYSQINYYTLTGSISTKQYIDGYGKLRGLFLPGKYGEMLMIIPPSAPENLKTSSEIIRTDMKNVLTIFSNPIACSLDKNGKMDGLWFSVLDIIYGIYIPIIPQEKDKDLFIGPENPLGENGIDVVPRLVKIRRDLDFIIQILKWLLSISQMSLEEFMNKYTAIGEMVGDSSKIYDFKNIGRIFPQVKTVEEGIEEIKKRVPTLFVGDRLFLYSEKFFNGILYLMQIYVKEYDNNNKIPTSITRQHLTEEDFITYSGVALFLKKPDFQSWLKSLFLTPEILSLLSINDAVKKEPYMYIAPDKHIYLIQNVMEGNIERALNAGYYWKKYKVNPGFKSPEYDETEKAKYVIYDISPANTIVPTENHADESLDYLSILRYNSFSYAAMLRLL